MEDYKVIGLMSGTSMDGLDVAYCNFRYDENRKWKFEILSAKTYDYSHEWRERLGNADKLDGLNLVKLHKDYGRFVGETVNDFLNTPLEVDFIASHGHTVFHQPSKGITLQIGDGAEIATMTGKTVVCDFRSTDVALGGQGAPLVPIGDRLLFAEYDYCLNLGGFANISFEDNNTRVAYDICPVNIVINHLMKETGKEFDDKGFLASTGIVNDDMLKELDGIEYYKMPYPKSLSREWLENNIVGLLSKYDIPLADKLRTITEHIAKQIAGSIQSNRNKTVLITGGGAYNDFLINKIKEQTQNKVVIPDRLIIEFKEALIFAFLGVLRMRGEVNCLSSVTGAKHDNCGGSIWLPS